MLYNPKWDKPSTEGFQAWLLMQKPETTFEYQSCKTCAVAQYLAFCSMDWAEYQASRGSSKNLNDYAASAWIRVRKVGGPDDMPTFADVLREMTPISWSR